MGGRELARFRRRTAALCGLIFLAGILHQALMSSAWHPMVMALVPDTPPHADALAQAMGDAGAMVSRTAGEGWPPSPAVRDCPGGQLALPTVAAPPAPASSAGPRPVAPPLAGATRPPHAGPDRLSSGRRRALLQVFII